MTLTLPVLDAALRVVFLVVGSEKAEILRAVLEDKARPALSRRNMVQPRDNGVKLFLVDEAAAALLDPASSQTAGRTRETCGDARGKAGEKCMILAGDIGGTKCNLALYRSPPDRTIGNREPPLRKPRVRFL